MSTEASVTVPARERTVGDGLGGRVVRALAWNATSQVVRQGTRVVTGIALARLLTPREYGVAGMALVFASLGIVFSDLGLGAALVQRPRVSERDRSTVFWTSVAVGTVMTVAGFFLAGPLARFYGQPDVRPLFQLLSLGFVLGALGMTQAAILQRELDFKSLELRIMAAVLVGAVVAVVLAVAGFGAWALIGSEVAVGAVSTGLLWWFSPWRPTRQFSVDTLRRFGPFSLNLVGKSFVDYLGRNSDNILIGRFLGSAPLGAYAVAYNIMLLPIRQVIQPIQETLFPALSRIQDDRERVGLVWLRVTRLIAAVVLPAMLGLAVTARDLVPAVLGHKWDAAIPVVQVLAIVAVMQSLSALGAKVLTAVDRTGLLMRYSVVSYAVTLPAFVVGLHWGITGVATAYAIVNLPLQGALVVLTCRVLGLSLGSFGRALTGVTIAGAGMLVATEGLRLFLVHEHTASLARLAATIATGALTYPILCRWLSPSVYKDLREAIAARRSRVGPV